MKYDIVNSYSNNILKPIDDFIKAEQSETWKEKNIENKERAQIIEKANDLYIEKLKTFSNICDEYYAFNKKE